MAKRIAVYGAGGFAREVAQLIRDINDAGGHWDLVGHLSDDEVEHGQRVGDQTVLGGREWLLSHRDVAVAIGIGAPAAKYAVAAQLPAGCHIPNMVHPDARVGRGVTFGIGAVVTAGCILTTDIDIGDFVTLNLACTVGHDVALSEFSTLAPGTHVSGNVVVGQGTDVGTGSSIIQGVEIGQWSVVGAGAVVTTDLPPNCTAVGVPAKAIKFRQTDWHVA